MLSLSSAALLTQLIGFAATPLLSRLYSPSNFGVLAAFTSIAATLLVISSARYDLAVPVQRSDESANSLIIASLVINTLVAFITLPFISIFGLGFAATMNAPLLAPYLWLLPLFIFFAGAYRVYVSAAIRINNYSLIARTRISQALATSSFQIIGGLAKIGAIGLVGGFALGSCVGVFLLIRKIGSPFFLSRKGRSFRKTVRLLKANIRFPKFDMPAAALDTLGAQLPSLLLAIFFGPAIAGFYAITYRLLAAPATLVGQAAGQVLLGSARDLLNNGQLPRHLKRGIFSLSALMLVPVVFCYFFSESLVVWILGGNWVAAGIYAKWIAIGLATQLVYSPLSSLLLATDGQHVNLKIHLVLLILKSAALLVGYKLASPLMSVIGVSLANAAGYLLALVWLYRHVMSKSASLQK
ncbi:oligosaccharide flippase family protein [Variovorax sp. RB3P1]|uniref:oligosaccharide flippase family protein n=1 Tax=Variovorax sp. RB3P1 TaxID=3443732 RepID=UPI003F498D80